jgi:hypothetical protein
MELYVIRDTFTDFSSIGEMLVEQAHECYTLEPVWSADLTLKPRAIPERRYPVKRRPSKEHKRDVPGVEDVPGFSDIEMHWGNFPRDTKACTLTGKTKGPLPDFIGGSKVAFDHLFDQVLVPAWDRGEEVFVTYMNGTDAAFRSALDAFLGQGSEGSGIERETPLFYHPNGAIDRERTLAEPCYSGLVINPRKGGQNATNQRAG